MATSEFDENQLTMQIAQLFPSQGNWSESDYFRLPDTGIVELVEGRLEVAPMPSIYHQVLVLLLQRWFNVVIEPHASGLLFTVPTRLRIGPRHYREPDLMFVAAENLYRHQVQFFEVADIVVEVISPDDPSRDLVDKRQDYAVAGVPEYWIVDPRHETVSVLALQGEQYHVINQAVADNTAESTRLAGLVIDVKELFRTARTTVRQQD